MLMDAPPTAFLNEISHGGIPRKNTAPFITEKASSLTAMLDQRQGEPIWGGDVMKRPPRGIGPIKDTVI